MATLDAKVYALDAKTGKVIWTAQNGDPKLGQTITGAPLIIRDKVLVGISGGEYGVRGYLSAFNLDTGKLVWRAYSVGPDADILFDPAKTIDGATQRPVGANSSVKSWENEDWKLGGGTTWGWYTYDPQLNLVLLRLRKSRNVESHTAARRQQVVHDALRAKSGHRRCRVGLPDDSSRCLGL